MPTAGPWAARLAEVATSADNTTYADIERIANPRFSGTNDTAETSSNDSGGNKEFIATWGSNQLSFDMVADEAATGQEAVWTSYLTKSTIYWRLRPKGNASTEKELFARGMVTNMEENLDKGGSGMYAVTVQLSGAVTRQNQT